MWANLCDEIGRPEWGAEDIARTRRHILDNSFRVEIEQVMAAWMQSLTSETIMRRLQARGVPCGMIRTIDDVHHDDTELDLRMFAPIDLATGARTLIAGPVFEFREKNATEPAAPPVGRIRPLDADHADITAELARPTEQRAP
jgi:crotonobetainyl-CoA:carnitine CoA-transferase CaiB-like acyl-CoA transferase